MSENIFEKFINKKYPKNIQNRIENFAKESNSNFEYYFRAGYIALKCEPDIIIVNKKDLNLRWYKSMREMINKERKNDR